MGKQFIYAVRNGRQVGLFYSQEDLRKAVQGYPDAEYMYFQDEDSAIIYLAGESKNTSGKK